MSNKKHFKTPKFRFMAMSKLIGLIVFAFVFMITIFSMKEMHDTGNYDSLPQLIISAFGFASVYSGFYLTMAKVEHVEEERSNREKELIALKNNNLENSDKSDEIELKKSEIISLIQKVNDLLSESNQPLL